MSAKPALFYKTVLYETACITARGVALTHAAIVCLRAISNYKKFIYSSA